LPLPVKFQTVQIKVQTGQSSNWSKPKVVKLQTGQIPEAAGAGPRDPRETKPVARAPAPCPCRSNSKLIKVQIGQRSNWSKFKLVKNQTGQIPDWKIQSGQIQNWSNFKVVKFEGRPLLLEVGLQAGVLQTVLH